MALLAAFAVFVASSGASELDQSARISRGRNAEVGQFPHMVGITVSEYNEQGSCGGTLISQEWVLTAAHCVDTATGDTRLYLGTIYRDQATVAYRVPQRNIIIHFLYNPENSENDIALIKIPETTICSGIAPIRLPKKSEVRSYQYEMGIAAGWGATNDDALSLAHRLQWAFMPIISNEDCRALSEWPFPDSVICVDTSNFGTICDGDSGGPLVLRRTGELVGVASLSAIEGCQSGKPAIFTRVGNFLNWIETNTGISLD